MSPPLDDITALRAAVPEPRDAARGGPVSVKEAADQFEAYLVGELLRTGSKPLSEDDPLGGGPGGRMYRELFLEEVARLAVRRGGLGIGRAIEQQLATGPPDATRKGEER